MIVEVVKGQTLDTDSLDSFEDILMFLKNLSAKEVTNTYKDKLPEGYELFDELLPNEIGVRNFLVGLNELGVKTQEKLFPANIKSLVLLAKLTKSEAAISLPAVDFEQYSEYQKLGYIARFTQEYLAHAVQSRIGYGMACVIGNDGKIYVLKDLRDLHSSSL